MSEFNGALGAVMFGIVLSVSCGGISYFRDQDKSNTDTVTKMQTFIIGIGMGITLVVLWPF